MKYIFKKIRNIKYIREKTRFFVFGVGLILILCFSSYLLSVAYSKYEVKTRIFANIDKALYIFGTDDVKFNLDPSGIIPRDEPYVYKFSVSNFNSEKESDVDMEYNLKIRTTTNLPIEIKLYRNEDYKNSSATNLFNTYDLVQDVDDAWYRNYGPSQYYQMMFEKRTTDVYTIVINFPTIYRQNEIYADYIESIEVSLESRQII